MSEILTAALSYAARGWHVFPCKPGEKRPATANGFKDATTDPARIRAWWTAQPNANLALATGKASGVFVIDLDTKAGVDGYAAWGDVCAAHGWRSRANVIAAGTPSGGCHIYFRHLEGVTNGRGALPAGVDVRGDGGYVLLPPSRIAGRDLPYSWLYPDATDIMDAPAWLLDVLKAKPAQVAQPVIERPAQIHIEAKHPAQPASNAIAAVVRVLAQAAEGERNNRLLWSACRLFDHGLPLADVEAQLVPVALGIGLDERETAATIRSAEKQERRSTQRPMPIQAAQARRPATLEQRQRARLRRLGVSPGREGVR
jgi:hypothetical protein